MKALVGAFNQEKALVGAFSVIVKTGCGTDGALHSTTLNTFIALDHRYLLAAFLNSVIDTVMKYTIYGAY